MIKDNYEYNEEINQYSDVLNDLRNKLPQFFYADTYDDNGNLVSRGDFDIEKFKNAIGVQDNESIGSYKLDFIGKNYAKKQAGERPTTVIVPNKKHNQKTESSNFILTGDNLEGLRHMQNNYVDAIGFIYIDPPYNTGSDGFVYPDSFEYSDENLKDMFGLTDEELVKFKSIQGKSNHSAWLAFMYPRLILGRKLLKETGMLAVSIDENEFATLKIVLDEIFGESSFIGDIIRKTKSSTNDSKNGFNQQHEHTLLYAKNINKVSLKGEEKNFNQYKNTDNDEKGPWKSVDPSARSGSQKSLFPITNPYTKRKDYPPQGRYWAFSQSTFKEWVKDGKIKFKKDYKENERGFIVKKYLKEIQKQNNPVNSLFATENKYMNQSATKYLKKIFDGKTLFTSPKPVEFVKDLVKYLSKEEDIILDFFAGSGTTGEAVLNLNQDEKSKRNFILMQLPEKTYIINDNGEKVAKKGSEAIFEAGFETIDQLTKKRIDLINDKFKDSKEEIYKHFYIVKPLKESIENIMDFENISLSFFDDMIEDFGAESLGVEGDASGKDTILRTWLAMDGYDFNVEAEKLDFSGYQADYINNRLYLIEEGWSSSKTKELINRIGTNKLAVQTIVVYSYSFGMFDIKELEIGLSQIDKKINLIKRL